jgi:glycosyltransferase involved in cell wall biosynthesis
MQPFVSFCFTTFKRHDYLKDTLESVRKQTFDDYEVIVSDNDPEQSGRVVVEGMADPRFKYFPNEENLGMKKSFNRSLQRSSGKFVVMIADDDPVYPDMLATLVDLMERFPGYGMYLGGADWFCTNPKVAKLYKLKVGTNSLLSNEHELDFIQTFTASDYLRGFFSFKIFPAYLWSTGMVRREALLEMGGVPDYGTPFLGDYAYLSLMGSHSGAVTINRSLGRQTIHAQNFGRNQYDQLTTAATGFTRYLEERLQKLDSWPIAKHEMYHFVGLWIISHMAFLHHYFSGTKKDREELEKVEAEIFKIDFIRKYKVKYYLKKNFPRSHERLVILKKWIKR